MLVFAVLSLWLLCSCVRTSNIQRFKHVKVDGSSISAAMMTSLSNNEGSIMGCCGRCSDQPGCNSVSFNNSVCNQISPWNLTLSGLNTQKVWANIDLSLPTTGNLLLFAGQILTVGTMISSMEVVNLSGSNGSCAFTNSLPSYPFAGLINGGGYSNGVVASCGGLDSSSTPHGNCYVYSNLTNKWEKMQSLLQANGVGSNVFLDSNTFLNTGGLTANAIIGIIQVFSLFKGFTTSSLPFVVKRHCTASINNSHVVLVGGGRTNVWDAADVGNVGIINVPTGLFTQLPNIDIQRIDPFCGVITRSTGVKELVVAGGVNYANNQLSATALIIPLDGTTRRTGPPLPTAMAYGKSVPYNGSTFLAIHPAAILKYDVVGDTWITLPQKMSTARTFFGAALIPEDFVKC